MKVRILNSFLTENELAIFARKRKLLVQSILSIANDKEDRFDKIAILHDFQGNITIVRLN